MRFSKVALKSGPDYAVFVFFCTIFLLLSYLLYDPHRVIVRYKTSNYLKGKFACEIFANQTLFVPSVFAQGQDSALASITTSYRLGLLSAASGSRLLSYFL